MGVVESAAGRTVHQAVGSNEQRDIGDFVDGLCGEALGEFERRICDERFDA